MGFQVILKQITFNSYSQVTPNCTVNPSTGASTDSLFDLTSSITIILKFNTLKLSALSIDLTYNLVTYIYPTFAIVWVIVNHRQPSAPNRHPGFSAQKCITSRNLKPQTATSNFQPQPQPTRRHPSPPQRCLPSSHPEPPPSRQSTTAATTSNNFDNSAQHAALAPTSRARTTMSVSMSALTPLQPTSRSEYFVFLVYNSSSKPSTQV